MFGNQLRGNPYVETLISNELNQTQTYVAVRRYFGLFLYTSLFQFM